jgi:hypothetical protein
MPGRRVLDEGRWPVDFRMEKMRRGEGDEGTDRMIEMWIERVAVGRKSEHKKDSA